MRSFTELYLFSRYHVSVLLFPSLGFPIIQSRNQSNQANPCLTGESRPFGPISYWQIIMKLYQSHKHNQPHRTSCRVGIRDLSEGINGKLRMYPALVTLVPACLGEY